MSNKLKMITDGLVKNNPTFVLLLGMCPTLATTTSAINGLSTIFKLVGEGGASPHYVLSWANVGILVLTNLLIIILLWVLESDRLVKHTSTKLVLYDRIELITPDRREELVADLQKRLGLKIDNLEIGHVDFLKDSAFIKVYYTLGKGESNTIDSLQKAKDYVE